MVRKSDKAPSQPGQMVINKLQASRVAKLGGVPAEELQGQTTGAPAEKLRLQPMPV